MAAFDETLFEFGSHQMEFGTRPYGGALTQISLHFTPTVNSKVLELGTDSRERRNLSNPPMTDQPTSSLCDACRQANPDDQAGFPPPSWKPLDPETVPDLGAWASGVQRCTICGSLWVFKRNPKDDYYSDVHRLSHRVLPLLKTVTSFEEAWSLRDALTRPEQRYMELFLYYAEIPWLKAARTIVAEMEAVEGDALERDGRFLLALYGNFKRVLQGGVMPAAMAELRQRVVAVLPAAAKWAESLLGEMQARENQRTGNLAHHAETSREEAEAAIRRAANPSVPPGRPLVWTDSEAGPERITDVAPGRLSAMAIGREAAAKLGANPFPYFAPIVLMLFFVEFLSQGVQAGQGVAQLVFFLMFLSAYAAAAATVAERWEVGGLRLFMTRSSVIFVYCLILLPIPLMLLLLHLAYAVAIGHADTGVHEDGLLLILAVILSLWRLWPMISIPYVYQGYNFRMWGNPAASGAGPTWIGPGIKTAWRLSGQKGFGQQVTLPAALIAGAWLGLLELLDWPLGLRLLTYGVVLPAYMQYMDEAVDQWRIATDRPEYDG